MIRQEAQITTMPAPVGGLNVRDLPTALAPTDALTLINLFPETDGATLRGGSSEYIGSGLGSGAVDTLAVLVRGASQQMLAGANSKLYEVTTATPADRTGAAVITVNRWDWVEFGDSATANAAELLLVNGTDAPLLWTGSGNVSAWTFYEDVAGTPTAFSAIEDFTGIAVFKNRVFLWKKNSRDFWFGQLGRKPGTGTTTMVQRFPLSGVRGTQGNIVAMETWSRDSGSGADDFLVILTDRGSAIIYQGSNPATAQFWSLVGVYQIPPPVDRRSVTKLLDDVAIVTQSDVVLLSQVIRNQGISGTESKVSRLVRQYVSDYGSNTGWQFHVWQDRARAYINVPTSATTARQIVLNTRTLAACEYEGWPARVFSTFRGELYYGNGAGDIIQAETGANDDEAAITWRYESGFLQLGKAGFKQLQAMRPVWGASDSIEYGYAVGEDLTPAQPNPVGVVGDATGWSWATGTWGTIKWNTLGNTSIQRDWLILEGSGEYLSIAMAGSYKDVSATLYSVNLAWTPGGGW